MILNWRFDIWQSKYICNFASSDFSPNTDWDFPDDVPNGSEKTDVVNAPFTGKTKLNKDVGPLWRPLDYLKLFINNDFIYILVNATNRFAETTAENDELKENSRMERYWFFFTYLCHTCKFTWELWTFMQENVFWSFIFTVVLLLHIFILVQWFK